MAKRHHRRRRRPVLGSNPPAKGAGLLGAARQADANRLRLAQRREAADLQQHRRHARQHRLVRDQRDRLLAGVAQRGHQRHHAGRKRVGDQLLRDHDAPAVADGGRGDLGRLHRAHQRAGHDRAEVHARRSSAWPRRRTSARPPLVSDRSSSRGASSPASPWRISVTRIARVRGLVAGLGRRRRVRRLARRAVPTGIARPRRQSRRLRRRNRQAGRPGRCLAAAPTGDAARAAPAAVPGRCRGSSAPPGSDRARRSRSSSRCRIVSLFCLRRAISERSRCRVESTLRRARERLQELGLAHVGHQRRAVRPTSTFSR